MGADTFENNPMVLFPSASPRSQINIIPPTWVRCARCQVVLTRYVSVSIICMLGIILTCLSVHFGVEQAPHRDIEVRIQTTVDQKSERELLY